ncbi:MAG TPA: GNAT family N-acetyltransferase [Candidatus Hydrothermia bacterium]|nr:GNAT family N-acetyltransferase [Candidatus Hydrothermae bacterium]MDD3649569.1 GNAT family N-acetyltransferase [Candidatus Hydrothermia bacterium]MDD5572775.1 GNAT family N-acetyltransferase [Candidatus Hydrothermia bacterium]HOK23481.1 GNAT family N-acetyltransferase [Candidatus Hydrothermia bacterium]HOP32784.1 GNAT family N-acetyltransferase [Candidatus Hydrothermia bacterium]
MKVRLITNKRPWDEEVSKFTEHLFYSHAWYNTMSRPWHMHFLAKCERSIMPILANSLNLKGYSGPWGSFGGPIGDDTLSLSLIKATFQKLRLRHLIIYREKPLTPRDDSSNFHLNEERHESVVLELRDPETVFKELHENRKRNLRKALKENFRLEILTGIEGANRYIKLLKVVKAERKNFYFHNPTTFKRIAGLENALFFFSEKGKDLAAAVILKLDRNTLFFWHGVNSLEALHSHAGDFLQWEIILYGIQNHFDLYYLGTSPNTDLLRYKLSWGGSIKEIFIYSI